MEKIPEEKFKTKYRISSTRLQNWDYSWDGYYFITICTKNKQNFFGEIKDRIMNKSNIGEIAEKFWLEIPDHFSNVKLDKFIIMPNHVHGILIIDGNDGTKNVNIGKNRFQNQGKNTISSIVGSYKSICTKTINKTQNEIFFAWQPRFYDHIIRNEKELNDVKNYILNNPKNWQEDENFKKMDFVS